VVDIEYKSNKKRLTLWLTTQDEEITIGFTGLETLNDWHTHMSLFGASTPEEEINEAVKLIHNIISDKTPIIYSSVLGYFLGNINETKEFQEPGEIIESTYWNKL
jgi:hypothetical protein